MLSDQYSKPTGDNHSLVSIEENYKYGKKKKNYKKPCSVRLEFQLFMGVEVTVFMVFEREIWRNKRKHIFPKSGHKTHWRTG